MAELISLDHTNTSVPLVAHHIVGRSRKCQLRIDRDNVSGVHAEVVWTGGAWLLRDLSSTNGTFIDGRRIGAHEDVALGAGAQVSFGVAHPEYRVVDASPPRLIAFGPDGGAIIGDESLYLPPAEDWGAVVMQDADGRWIVDDELTGPRPLAHEQCIVVRGQAYTVHLPCTVPLTCDPAGPLDDIALEVMVSRDGEHIDIRVRHGGAIHFVEPRAHGPLLHVLARTRAVDARRVGLPEREHGWMHREDLMKALACKDMNTLNVWIHRARRQFEELKVPRLVDRIIERRELAGQLRLGLRNVTINGA